MADSRNPVMQGILDYLVEEGSAEEEALMGIEDPESGTGGAMEIIISTDIDLFRVLDRLILYLRIVYSFDFYSGE